MANDRIHIRILEDGELVIETDQVSQANHKNADQLVKLMGQLMGGEVTIKQGKPGAAPVEHVHTQDQR